MLTRRGVTHQYGFAGYYEAPYHVAMLADAYPVEGRMVVSRFEPVALNPAVLVSARVGQHPWAGMDPCAPESWTRPYNPQPGMFGRLHDEQARGALRK